MRGQGGLVSSELVCLLVYLVGPAVGQFDFKPAKERQGEDHQQEEQEDVEHSVGGHGVERVRAEEGCHQQSQAQIDDNDAQTVGHGIANALLLI